MPGLCSGKVISQPRTIPQRPSCATFQSRQGQTRGKGCGFQRGYRTPSWEGVKSGMGEFSHSVHGTLAFIDPIKTMANVLLGKRILFYYFLVVKIDKMHQIKRPQYLRKLHLLRFCSAGSYPVVWGRDTL